MTKGPTKFAIKFGEPDWLAGSLAPPVYRLQGIAEAERLLSPDRQACCTKNSGSSNITALRLAFTNRYGKPLVQLRHGGKLNVIYCDGHADREKYQNLLLDHSDENLRRWNNDHEPHRERLPNWY